MTGFTINVVSWYIGSNVSSEKHVFHNGPFYAHGSLGTIHILPLLFKSIIIVFRAINGLLSCAIAMYIDSVKRIVLIGSWKNSSAFCRIVESQKFTVRLRKTKFFGRNAKY
jgi:hypothetical protein